MNLEKLLTERTEVIRFFYEKASQPFIEIKASIENEDEPFVPPYSEDGEPPFLEEWMQADTGIETVGHACISMLSSSLLLFLEAWRGRWEIEQGRKLNVNYEKKGWFNGYRKIFNALELPLSNCEADLDIIEQTILARNSVQHPEGLISQRVFPTNKDLKKFPNPFFAKESELKMANMADDGEIAYLLKPSISPTKEKVFEAIEQVEKLCSWLEGGYR